MNIPIRANVSRDVLRRVLDRNGSTHGRPLGDSKVGRGFHCGHAWNLVQDKGKVPQGRRELLQPYPAPSKLGRYPQPEAPGGLSWHVSN